MTGYKDVNRRLTMDELIRLTTIQKCKVCGLNHAIVRTCEEAKIDKNFLDSRE